MFSVDTTGLQGLLSMNADGSFSYDPNGQFDGLDEGESFDEIFSYTVTDGTAFVTTTVTITVTGVNDAPVAADDAYTTDENTPLAIAAPGVLGNDTDVDGDGLTVTDVDDSALQGTLTWAADGSFTYDPAGQFEGLDDGETATETFTYTVWDGTTADTATVTITVTGVDDPPVAVDDDYTTDEDSVLNVATSGVLENDYDVDGDPFQVAEINGDPAAVGVEILARLRCPADRQHRWQLQLRSERQVRGSGGWRFANRQLHLQPRHRPHYQRRFRVPGTSPAGRYSSSRAAAGIST